MNNKTENQISNKHNYVQNNNKNVEGYCFLHPVSVYYLKTIAA